MTDRLPAVWGCLKTDLFATWHRAECLNSCFGAQTDRKLYLCPAEEYTSSMFFLILLYPNNNMENKTRKTEKKKYCFHISSSAAVVSRSLLPFWRCILAVPGSRRRGLSGTGTLMVPPHHLCWLGLRLQQMQPSPLEVQHVVEKHPWHHAFK